MMFNETAVELEDPTGAGSTPSEPQAEIAKLATARTARTHDPRRRMSSSWRQEHHQSNHEARS
jgi:hypothetical protein